jgi:hypothetical protein
MNSYELLIEDIYDKSKNKKIGVYQSSVQLAHKDGLKHVNALREEISRITLKGRTVYTFKSGFLDANE